MSYESLVRSGFFDKDRPEAAVYYVRHPRNIRQRFQRIILPYPKKPTVDHIAATDNLIRVYYELKTCGGQAPGPDGFTYGDWSRREVASILRDLSAAVCAGRYRPQSSRSVPIPKANGGVRILRISNLCDRVVATALHQAMEPVWEPVFLPNSMGFRPGRGVLRLLAELERIMLDQDRWVLAVDDVKNAFDNVVIDDVIMDHAHYLTDPSLLSLIEVVLRGGDGEKRTRGIDQGSAYSPTALNVRLHHAHDLGINQGQYPPWFRYADNLVYIGQDVPEGLQALERARQLLGQAGFALKGTDGPPVNLRQGERAQLLGFTLCRKNDALHFGLGSNAWSKLEQSLIRSHTTENPTENAIQVIRGWITSYGPAFETLRTKTLRRIRSVIIHQGFRESFSMEVLVGWCRDAWQHWNILRNRVTGLARTSNS
jgi:RNA-directed DNA polymerase